MTTYAFLDHREVHQPSVEARLEAEIEKLLQVDSEFLFLTGGMGQFDSMGTDAVRAVKRRYKEKHITLALVMPYMSNRLNTDKEYYRLYYDQIIIPEKAANAHYKAAIQIRNRWMVDQADTVIAYICRDFGGAFTSVKYSKRQGKLIINIAEKK